MKMETIGQSNKSQKQKWLAQAYTMQLYPMNG